MTLALLRHAKSSWDDPSLDDFDRPLAKRGITAASRMGAYIEARGLVPDAILCSDAARARQTLDLMTPHFTAKPAITFEHGLYLASSSALIARARRLDAAAVRHVMLVGHDPGMHQAARELIGAGDPEEIRALERKFPTAALAVIVFRVGDWAKVARAKGTLKLFVTPKTLA